MSASPPIAVGLPVYNGENYLEEAIASVLRQDFDGLELIIGDNGSGDATEEICRTAAATDPRVRYERSPVNRGATWNYNRLVALGEGEYFKWAAHDDLLGEGFLQRCVSELEADADAVLAYPRTVLIDTDGVIQDDSFDDGLDLREVDPVERFSRYLLHSGEQHAVFGVMRRRVLEQTRLIANCWGGDQVLLAEMLLRGTFDEVPDRLFMRRYHPESSFVANRTAGEVARWYDPTRRVRSVLPRSRLTLEFARVVAAAPGPPRTRVALLVALARYWLPQNARVIGGELKASILNTARRVARS